MLGQSVYTVEKKCGKPGWCKVREDNGGCLTVEVCCLVKVALVCDWFLIYRNVIGYPACVAMLKAVSALDLRRLEMETVTLIHRQKELNIAK